MGTSVYSIPGSNLIPGLDIKTRKETAQCLDFLHLNLKTNQTVYKRGTPDFLPGHVFMQNLHASHRENPQSRLLPPLHQSTQALSGRTDSVRVGQATGGRSLSSWPHMLNGQSLPTLQSTPGHWWHHLAITRQVCGFHLGQIRSLAPKTHSFTLIKPVLYFNLHLAFPVSFSSESRREEGYD